MPRRSLLLSIPLVALVLGLAAPSAAADGRPSVLTKDQVLGRGMARASLRGRGLLHAKAYLRENGEMAMTLSYSRDGRRADFSFDVRWREQARGGAAPARDITPGGLPDLYWHPLKQVHVRYKVYGAQPGVDLDGAHTLARTVADQVARAARPWAEPFASLALRRPMRVHDGYSLVHSKHLGMSKNSKTTELDYRSPTRTVQVGGKPKYLSRGYEITVRWVPTGQRPPSNEEARWRYIPLPRDRDHVKRVLTVVRSRTHYIKVDLRGEHYGRHGHSDRFEDRRHFEVAMERVQQVLARFERHLAQPRATVGPGAGTGTPLVTERPAEQAGTSQGSGTITSVTGRLMVLRGGRRVNVASGGRVQQGDTLITGSGTVVIRFDNPGAGTDGTLTIAPRSKVTIEEGPYRPKTKSKPTRFRLQEGAVRFARPHDHRNPRIEFATPGDVAIFGLVGTDAALVRADFGHVFALRDGLADVTVRGGRAKVVMPISSLVIDKEGRVRNERSIDAAQYRETSERIGLGR